MVGTKGNYICTKRYEFVGEHNCREPQIPGSLIESVAWDYIMGLIKNPVGFEEKLRQAQANEVAMVQPKQKELEHVIALLKDTEIEADEIARATRTVKGIVGKKLEQQSEEVDKRYHALMQHKSQLQEALAVELTEDTIDNLLHFRKTVDLGLENPTFEDRRRWLEILQVTVTVTGGIAVVACRLGGDPLNYNLFEVDKSRIVDIITPINSMMTVVTLCSCMACMCMCCMTTQRAVQHAITGRD